MKISVEIQGQKGIVSGNKVLVIDNVFKPGMVNNILSTEFRFCSIRPDKLCCCHCINPKCYAGKRKCIHISTKGEAAFFVFSNGNKKSDNPGLFRECKLCGRSFNLFYISGENKFKLSLDSKHWKDYMFVLLSRKYFRHLINDYPDLIEPGNSFAKDSFAPLLSPQKYFSYDVCRVIEQIQNCSLHGDIASLFLEGKIMELFAYIKYSNKKKEEEVSVHKELIEKIFKAKEILETHYNKPPTIHELAISVGTNDTTLKKGFKELFNTTVYGHLFNYRMEKAKKLLREKRLSIQDVSLEIGYQKQANFSTAFKRKYGFTPLDFAKGEL